MGMDFPDQAHALIVQALHLHAGRAPLMAALPDFPDIAVYLLNCRADEASDILICELPAVLLKPWGRQGKLAPDVLPVYFKELLINKLRK